MEHVDMERWLSEIVELARIDRQHEIPEPVVSQVKQIHPGWAETVARLPRFAARLVLDTFLKPACAGVRGQWPADRHCLYQAGRYSVDLHEQMEPGAATIAVVGQICDAEQPDRTLRSVPVVLLRRSRLLGLTLTNGFGEFQMEYPPSYSLTLLVAIDGRNINIRLRGPRLEKRRTN